MGMDELHSVFEPHGDDMHCYHARDPLGHNPMGLIEHLAVCKPHTADDPWGWISYTALLNPMGM